MGKKVKLLSICKPKQYKTISKNELIDDGKYLVYGANGVIGKSNKYTHENPDKLYVIVEYDIHYKDIDKTITNKVSSQLKLNFEQGKAYTLNLTLGLTPIEFDVTTVERISLTLLKVQFKLTRNLICNCFVYIFIMYIVLYDNIKFIWIFLCIFI
jgi:hypothetical protein